MTQPKYNHNEAIKIARKNKYPTEYPEIPARKSVGLSELLGIYIVAIFHENQCEIREYVNAKTRSDARKITKEYYPESTGIVIMAKLALLNA